MSDVGYVSTAVIRIKKESPNEGTETPLCPWLSRRRCPRDKKRIPE